MFDDLALCTIPDDAEALRQPLQSLIARYCTAPADIRARSWMGFDRDLSKALGTAGYVGMLLPRKYGGHDRSPFDRFVVTEELLSAGAPVAAHWIADRQSALQILKFGTEAQQELYLPAICRGESVFCIGMSEPESGSDLASVRTTARAQPDGTWRLSGQKIWTTYAHHADHMIALVRTDTAAEQPQLGLSQFVIDLHLPGITIRPIVDLAGDSHFSEVFFDEVELPTHALLGRLGQGWTQVTAELAFERSGPERIYSSVVLLDSWLAHVRKHPSPQRVELAGRLTAELATLRSLSLAVTRRLADGASPIVEASLVKDLGTTFEQSIPRTVADDLARNPDEPVDAELVRALSYVSQVAPTFSLRGGTREILRGIIARGLGLR